MFFVGFLTHKGWSGQGRPPSLPHSNPTKSTFSKNTYYLARVLPKIAPKWPFLPKVIGFSKSGSFFFFSRPPPLHTHTRTCVVVVEALSVSTSLSVHICKHRLMWSREGQHTKKKVVFPIFLFPIFVKWLKHDVANQTFVLLSVGFCCEYKRFAYANHKVKR